MKTTTTCISALIGAVLVASVTEAANMPTVPAPPGPPATFKRESRTLPLHKKRCNPGEIDERETNKPIGSEKVICRKACPEGYGVATDKCVWNEKFVPHIRYLKEISQGDGCYDDETPAVGAVDPSVVARRTCRASCPSASLGWLELRGECLFKPKEYSRDIQTFLSTCFDGWELIPGGGTYGVKCGAKCAKGYLVKPGDASKCVRKDAP